jgi:hypothetical protein
VFRNDAKLKLTCYVDASHNQYDDGRGHFGYSISIGNNNAIISAKSSKLKLNTLSSTESEYVAICEATREIVYLTNLINSLNFNLDEPAIVYEDNKSCIDMLYSESLNHSTTKHILPKFHFTKDQIKLGIIKVVYMETENQIADIFTKALPFLVHHKHADNLLCDT